MGAAVRRPFCLPRAQERCQIDVSVILLIGYPRVRGKKYAWQNQERRGDRLVSHSPETTTWRSLSTKHSRFFRVVSTSQPLLGLHPLLTHFPLDATFQRQVRPLNICSASLRTSLAIPTHSPASHEKCVTFKLNGSFKICSTSLGKAI